MEGFGVVESNEVSIYSSDLVCKANSLVEARYNLSLNEQKVLLCAISKINTINGDLDNESNRGIVSISTEEIMNVLGGGNHRYTEIMDIIDRLRRRELIINTGNGYQKMMWVASVWYIANEAVIELEFSVRLMPYLIKLKKEFTRYYLYNVINLKHKYSIRIYEMLKQYRLMNKRRFEIKELREVLGLDKDKYKKHYDFRTQVIKKAIDDINKNTDITVSFTEEKRGNRYVAITFKYSLSEDLKYEKYLATNYDMDNIRERMGLSGEKFSNAQIMEIYTEANDRTQGLFGDEINIDIYRYIKMNSDYCKGKARNKYSYLMEAIANDYANASTILRAELKMDKKIAQFT